MYLTCLVPCVFISGVESASKDGWLLSQGKLVSKGLSQDYHLSVWAANIPYLTLRAYIPLAGFRFLNLLVGTISSRVHRFYLPN